MATQSDSTGAQRHPGSRPPGGSRYGGRDRSTPSTPWRVEGARDGDAPRPDWSGFWRQVWWALLLLLLVNWLAASLALAPAERLQVSYTFFREQVQSGNVVEITSTGDTIEGVFARPVRYPPDSDQAVEGSRFETQRPAFADDGLIDLLLEQEVTVNARPPDRVPLWQQLVVGFGPTLVLIGLLVYLFRRSSQSLGGGLGGGLGGPGGGLGRSRARRYAPESGPRVTFADVAGIDEVQGEVREVVDFLRNPDRYRRLGATIPKGVLLSGPPGTGKTLLARAVAGEAGVPFFSVSAAEFIEMIVGVGASRVRDLFESARKEAPAIIFIDELDAVGRARGASGGIGGHDEREQTLNQLLTEMDGFDGTEGVVVLAATNRPEILDPALLRPGRFDRRLPVNPPDQAGRRQILAVHTRSTPLAPDVDLDELAAATPGMVGADLRNLVNEAALLAGRRHHDRVTRADVLDALEKIVLGAERKITLSWQERERTSYHESGHALLGMLTPGADPVRKISIIPRGHALGVTLQTPEADRYGYVQRYLKGRIAGALGGRAAEELVYREVSTGAENDLDNATRLARQMVGRWGMSERVGLASVLPAPEQEQLSLDGSGPAPATRELVDEEVRRILDECYQQALTTLRANRDRLDRLAHALLEHETLDAEQAYAAAGVPFPSGPAARPGADAVGAGAAGEGPHAHRE